MKSFYDRTGAP